MYHKRYKKGSQIIRIKLASNNTRVEPTMTQNLKSLHFFSAAAWMNELGLEVFLIYWSSTGQIFYLGFRTNCRPIWSTKQNQRELWKVLICRHIFRNVQNIFKYSLKYSCSFGNKTELIMYRYVRCLVIKLRKSCSLLKIRRAYK